MSVSRGLPELPQEIRDITDEEVVAARRTVAAFSTDADECRIFLAMLGIGRNQHSDGFVGEIWSSAFNG